MSEGRTYLCTWRQAPAGFEVWVKARPKLRASAESFEAADQELYEVILRVLGDGENAREYIPPRPDALDHDGLLYRLKQVTGVGRATIANELMPAFWTKGVCPDCRHAWGARTTVTLEIQRADSDTGLMARAQRAFQYPHFYLYSTDFVSLLTPAERRRFTWRPVRRLRGTKPYLEIVASRTVLPLATFKEQYVGHNLYRCPTCGYKNDPTYSFVPPTPSAYVAEHDIPRRLPSCFTVGQELAICFTTERWAELVERKAARGLWSQDIGVVDSRLVERRPKRRTVDLTDEWSKPW